MISDKRMTRILLRLALTLAVGWLLLSGLFKAQLLILGVLSVALVCWLAWRMNVLTHREQPVFIRYLEVARYWSWLLVEIFTLGTVSATPDTEMGRVIYANSITLTPGTTAINFTRSGDILVHALHQSSLDELEEDVMAAHVRQMESKLDLVSPGESASDAPSKTADNAADNAVNDTAGNTEPPVNNNEQGTNK